MAVWLREIQLTVLETLQLVYPFITNPPCRNESTKIIIKMHVAMVQFTLGRGFIKGWVGSISSRFGSPVVCPDPLVVWGKECGLTKWLEIEPRCWAN